MDPRTNGKALSHDEAFYTDHRGKRKLCMTTQGWDLLVEWHDGTTSWVPLKDLKESNPVEVAAYAVANKITDEPAFLGGSTRFCDATNASLPRSNPSTGLAHINLVLKCQRAWKKHLLLTVVRGLTTGRQQ